MKKIRILLALPILIFLAACAYNAETAQTSYDTLRDAKTAYDTSMALSAELYNQCILDDGDKERIIKAMTIYCITHNASVAILGEYGKFLDTQIEALKINSPESYFEVKDELDKMD